MAADQKAESAPTAPTVIVVGSINVDITMTLPELPHPGETVTGGTTRQFLGGKGANQAAAAARLGARTFLVARIGSDEHGEMASCQLEEAGIETRFVGRDADVATGVAVVLTAEQGENLIGVASGANATLNAAFVESALSDFGRNVRDCVVVANLEVPMDAVAAAATWARSAGCRFVLNPAPARHLPAELLPLISVLTPNEHEVSQIGVASPWRLLESGVGGVVVTRGSEGVDLYDGSESGMTHVPPFPVEAIDTTGAGDAFTGALAWALATGRPLIEAASLASVAGALATRAVGAQSSLSTAAEVIQRWTSQHTAATQV